jgi:hypothetical protein
MSEFEQKAREFEGKAAAEIRKVGDKVDAKVRSWKKYLPYAIGTVVVAGVLFGLLG